MSARMDRILELALIGKEMDAQDVKWGPQYHPPGTGSEYFQFAAEQYRRECDAADARGELTWAHILLEEVYEALAEEDPEKVATELIQVAAVAVQAVISMRRQGLVE